jgi:hypothetical protein
MSEKDLSTLLRDRLALLEPPLSISPATSMRAGRRARRVRTGLVAGAAVAAVSLAVVAVALVGVGSGEPTLVATDTGSEPIDQAIADVVAREYAPYLATLPETPVTATDDEGNTLPLDAPGVTGVGVQYELPGEHTVTLGVHAADPTAITDCAEWDRNGTAVACDVSSLPDGTTIMTSVLAFGPPEPGGPQLPTILTAEQLANADPATLSWSHGVLVRTPDGDISGTYELLPAPSYDAARAAWQLPDDALLAAATDPTLTGYDFLRRIVTDS